MDIFSVIGLIGGLTFFLYGMHVMSTGLEKMAGGTLETTLKQMTSSPWKSILLGAGITIAIQSSSAMTVMLVGLVNSGIMQLGQTIGVIMGSNIGTTLTAWILAMSGIQSDNTWINLLKPENFSPLIAFAGIIMMMTAKKKKNRDIGDVLVGFAVLMYGMKLMSDSVAPLADMPEFASLLTAFNNPILGVLVGTAFTGIIQSSAASIGILQALAMTGSITYGMAIPIILGQNIGTCATALLSSIGVNKNAKRVAVVHVTIKAIGTVIFLTVVYGLNAIIHFSFMDDPIGMSGIAAVHSIFNILNTVVLLPFCKQLEVSARFLVRDDKKKGEEYSFIDERLLNTPSVAVSECDNMTVQMCGLSRATILSALRLMHQYSPAAEEAILHNEDMLDMYEDKLGTYLVKLASKDISDRDSRQISKMLHTIGDFERLGDHAVNLVKTAREMYQKKLVFSGEAQAELHVLTDALEEILDITAASYEQGDLAMATRVEPLEQVIDMLINEIKVKHIERLQAGNCTIEMGFILNDLLTNYERVSDHCSNIAVALIETQHSSFETHEYLSGVKSMSDENFRREFEAFSLKYAL